MPNPRKPRREALKPRLVNTVIGPQLRLDWSPAGQEWLAERLSDVIGTKKSSKEFAPFFRIVDMKDARALLRRMEELAKTEGRK